MMEPTFTVDGYPTEETEQAIREWDWHDFRGCFEFLAKAWRYGELGVRYELSPAERELVHADMDAEDEALVYVRLATGGWSGNESLLGALQENTLIHVCCWKLSASGGLHIYAYPRNQR